MAAVLTTPLAAITNSANEATQDLTLATNGATALTAGTTNWVSFQIMNCAATTISMKCTTWVRKEANIADGGYQYWNAGTAVKFIWFDGRALGGSSGYDSTNTDDWDKWTSADVTLVLEDASWQSTGAYSLATGIFSLVGAFFAITC